MIRDAQSHKWAMRFKQYSNGWHWSARWRDHGIEPDKMFQTKALAEADARQTITSCDHIAQGAEFFRRVAKRGTVCQLTAADLKAINRASRNNKKSLELR